MEKTGVVACTEMLTALADISVVFLKVIKDGQVTAADIPTVLSLVSNFGDFAVAVKDAPALPAEIKDLSVEEIKVLVQTVIDLVYKVKAA